MAISLEQIKSVLTRNTKNYWFSRNLEGDIYENYMGDFLLDWLDANDSIYLECSDNNSLSEKKQGFFSNKVLLLKHH